MRLKVTKPFEVMVSKVEGVILTNVGDMITLKERGTDYFYITKLNRKKVYLNWKPKEWFSQYTTDLY